MARKTKKKTAKKTTKKAAKAGGSSVTVKIVRDGDLVRVHASGTGGRFEGAVDSNAINPESLQNAVDQNLGRAVRLALG